MRRPALLLDGEWFGLTTDTRPETDIPESLQRMVAAGQAGAQRVRTATGPAIVLGVALPDASQWLQPRS